LSLPFTNKKGYFCSELVAKLFLELKLTKSSKIKPESIFPGDFCGEKIEALLAPGLSFEHQIIFEKNA
jgi:hypothetical protein